MPLPEQIAVFDNDGTLWSEQPMYTQAFFALHQVQALAPKHPAWGTTEPFASLITEDRKRAAAIASEADVAKVMAVAYAGRTTEEFESQVSEWIAAKHRQTGRPFSQMTYQPMLELLAYLRERLQGFHRAGGGIEFMRPWTELVYRILPDQAIGTTGALRFEVRSATPPPKAAEPVHNDDDEGPSAFKGILAAADWVLRKFGRQPQVDAVDFGRSGTSLLLYVHHTDSEREWAYDRKSHVSRLHRGLDEARAIANMKQNWKVIIHEV